eukprot:5920711-Prymnesium_polylepis.1
MGGGYALRTLAERCPPHILEIGGRKVRHRRPDAWSKGDPGACEPAKGHDAPLEGVASQCTTPLGRESGARCASYAAVYSPEKMSKSVSSP